MSNPTEFYNNTLVPMPANPQVNEAEAKQLAAWVLTQK